MTYNEMRIVIAEECGKLDKYTRQALERFNGRDGYPDAILQLARVPDYLNDLNAMSEAEKLLTEFQHEEFARILWPPQVPFRKAISATARQRAEAFLRTIGKWQDG